MTTEMEGNMDIPTPHEQELSEATAHVERNTIPAEEGRECVDGRYDQHSRESGFLARAGADFGYVMGLLGLAKEGKINLTPQEAVDKVYDAVTENGGRFYAHSDHHAHDSGDISGCGHIYRSTLPKNRDRYGINPDDVTIALNYMREKTAHQNVEEVELQGEHLEKGVLIVRGKDKTIDHHYDKDMYFVYDADRDADRDVDRDADRDADHDADHDADFQEELVKKMKIPGLNLDDFREILDRQTETTLSLLAPEKPIFEVVFENDKPKVSFVGYVEAA